ncbi:MAG: short-chain dehydrogenase [Pelodictyon luteolum]|uniref:Short-chain dehydrogenase n=1 Tax=Pelodictyon luteolum TaxID=1100 RepID=A0A165L7G8_PELLU|nr:SDR family oxidoreductase [Pelodictyon luteolum]KZK73673.1 MAG: short-chain dehydrogenase [Pelodictyon luteolum]
MTQPGKKVCFMTGATGRLGSEIALSVAGQGYTLFFTWHASEPKAEELLEKIRWVSPESEMVHCSTSSAKEIQAAFAAFRKRFDRLDLLIASASNFYATPLPGVSEEEWDSLVDTNLKGTFFTMQEASRIMQKQPFTSRIITMADISADLVWKSFAPYTVAKAGVVHLTKVFAKTFAPNILVNAIAPGTVTLNPGKDMDSEEEMVARIPLRRLGDPLDIVKAVLFLLESDYITGQVITVDGGRMLC